MEEEEDVSSVEESSIKSDLEWGPGGDHIERGSSCSTGEKMVYYQWLQSREEGNNANLYKQRSSREILEREPKVQKISRFKEGTSNYETKDSRHIKK
jgi:hypothetical protein